MKTIEILVGIPCSGKSTYCEKIYNDSYYIVSRDKIRLDLFGNKYKQNKYDEGDVTKLHSLQVDLGLKNHKIVILDNTHCKEKYIDEIINKYSKDCNIKIKFFDIPLWKAHYRNIIRYFKTGKWIPIKVMNQMYKNYNKINKQKYAKYMVYK
jgi:predicted kinase